MNLTKAVALLALATGGVLVVSTTTRTTPGITFSNRLTPAKDGRVVRSTLVPKTNWRGGQTWIITITHPAPLPVESLTFRAPTMSKYVFTDSIWAPFPTCQTYRVTVRPDTVLTTTGRVSTRRDSLTARMALCRAFTPVEAAFHDSFPTYGWRITWCGGWARRMTQDELDELERERLARAKTAADSLAAHTEVGAARIRPDSMPIERLTWGKHDTLQAEVGFKYRMAGLAKNRYTGRVQYLRDDEDTLRTVAACERERAAYEASPEGRTP